MRLATGFAFALASAGSVIYFMPSDSSTKSAEHVSAVTQIASGATPKRAPQPTQSIAAAPATITAVAQPRVFSPDKPLASTSSPSSIAPMTAPPVASFIAPVSPKLADPGVRKLSSSRPADEDARRELVRDLQRELKRVGCFEGEITGAWGSSSKRAMTAFTERVNATLPLEEPDYILLTLVQGHPAQACGKSCPSGQVMNDDNKCLPSAIVAQKVKRSSEKVANAPADTVRLRTTPSNTAPVAAKPPANTRVSSSWSTVVTETPAAVTPPQRTLPALPGRMAMGAPIETPLPTVETERSKAELAARKAEMAQAERNSAAELDRRKRAADAQMRLAKDAAAAKLKSQQSLAEAASKKTAAAEFARETTTPNTNPPAVEPVTSDASARMAVAIAAKPQLSEKRIKQGQIQRSTVPPAVVIAQSANAYRVPSPRFIPPSYAIGRIAVSAPRPSYAPEPRRWTRTIFSDITRMR